MKRTTIKYDEKKKHTVDKTHKRWNEEKIIVKHIFRLNLVFDLLNNRTLHK